MQSEPNTTSNSAFNTTTLSDNSNSSHHGFHPDEHLHSADHSGHGPKARVERTAGTRDGVASASSCPRGAGLGLPEELGRLSVSVSEGAEKQPAKASFRRISDYEKAASPPSSSSKKKNSEGPGFKITRRKGPVGDGQQLQDFPNEVLTHIISHLPADSLASVSLVSRKFHSLVKSPHAWRIAFARFFPGQDVIEGPIRVNRRGSDQENREGLRSEQRVFARLTALASWRSEYILRTNLLRSLARGKPSQLSPGRGGTAASRNSAAANNLNATAVVTYSSQLFAAVNHIHADFSTGRKSPRFIHGSDEDSAATSSDPNVGKIDSWGLGDPQTLPNFASLFVGEAPYGNGDGPAGLPNCMDVSQPFGMLCGEGFPGGRTYFRSAEEQRGRFLCQATESEELSDHESGIPKVPGLIGAVSAVWIAKSFAVPSLTDGLVGILTGSTLGVVTAYSLGADTSHGNRIGRGQLTSKWVLSPGVPIISIRVDDSYNFKRKSKGRIWAVALNALGEIFYLIDVPHSALLDTKVDDGELLRQAWKTGRKSYWQLVESSRRTAKDDPYNEFVMPGSYSPRSSADKMHLDSAQIRAETAEIETFLKHRPAHFRKICDGWDMRRRLEVDFAGDDGNGAGESIFAISCGLDGKDAEVRRYTRWQSEQASLDEYPMPKTPPMCQAPLMASLFGGGHQVNMSTSSPTSPLSSRTLPTSPRSVALTRSPTLVEEWKRSTLTLGNSRGVEITAVAIDMSTFALLTTDEDPLWTMNSPSEASSLLNTPSDHGSTPIHAPGQRARFIAVGTNTGAVNVWNMRGPVSTNVEAANDLHPVRTIFTDSPQISCLALSALYLVVGGNDGLVQAWDPLASTLQPIRTLNSRFSSRARRRLIQAEASIHGVGINLYAAGAIVLDPDSTVLCGMVSLGTHLRYWSYSSSAADQYQRKKRRLRRGERGSNGGPDRFTNTGRGALMDYIATEQEDLRREKLRRSKEEARLKGRFGVGLGGLSDEEALRYAEMVSTEAFQKDEERRMSDNAVDSSLWSSSTATPEGSPKGSGTGTSHQNQTQNQNQTDDEFDNDLEEAIRLSLLDGVGDGGSSPRASGSGGYDIPITYKQQKKGRRSASSSPSTSQSSRHRKVAVGGVAADDIEFALQLSLAEERSRREERGGGSPRYVGKGKGRAD